MCDVYLFEEGTPTSRSVVNSYMDPLEDADLVIVLVDNKDKITPATQREIQRAKALGKKCIYIFCDEREKEITELQQQIQSDTSGPRFYTVHEFSDIPKMAYKAVINDILSLYMSYCRGRVDYCKQNENQTESVENNALDFSAVNNGDITKETLKGFSYTKYVVQKEANVAFEDVYSEEEKDFNCACLVGLIMGSLITSMPDFSNIKLDIKRLYKGNIQKLILLRYEAIEAYFKGNLSECVKELDRCYDFCVSHRNIPKWLSNDIAIDLRNVQMELDKEKDQIDFHPKGQKILDQDLEPFYYPILDRIVSDYNAEIVKHQYTDLMNSPYTVNLGVTDYILDKATSAFMVAYHYGSLTHMLLHRKRLCEYLMIMSFEIRDHKMFICAAKMLLLMNDGKLLKQFMATYGENTNSINEKDIEYLREGIKKQSIEYKNILARIQMLRFFGFYYSDQQFEEETQFLFDRIEKYIVKKKSTSIVIKPMLEAIEENKARCKEQYALKYIYMLFRHGCKRYYDDAFKFLSHFYFKELGDEEQLEYQRFIIKYMCDEDIKKNCHYVYQAAQTLRQCETIPHAKLDHAVKNSNQDFFENTYLLNVKDHDKKESWHYIKYHINMISDANQTQGKNGTFSGYGVDPYKTIGNIMKISQFKCDSNQLKQLLKCIRGTLFAKTQTLDAKVEAIELLCVIQAMHVQNRQVKELVKQMESCWQDIAEAKELFLIKGYSRENLDTNFNILKRMVGIGNEEELVMSFVQMQNCDITCRMSTLSMIGRLVEIDFFTTWNDAEKNYLFYYIMNSSYSDNYDERFRAMLVLIKLLDSKYRQMCLKRFVEMIDTEPYINKVGLLARLKRTDLEDSKIQYILDKGVVDSHYWVRKVAQEIKSN